MPLIKQNLNFIFGLLLTILLTACGSENDAKDSANSSDPQPARVALIMKSLANEYFINMMEGAKAHQLDNAEKYELIVNGTKNETDLAQQVSLVEQMMAAQVDILVLAPVGSKGMLPVVKRAMDQGIVVVNIDNRFDQEVLEQMGMLVPFVGPADREGAKLVGLEVAKYLEKGDEVAIIGGLPGAYNAHQRQLGFEDAMSESSLNIISTQSADWESAKAATVAAAILSEKPNLKALLCSNDSMALGAVAAVRQAGRTGDVLVVGFDNLSAANDLVQSGELLATIDQHGDELAVYGIEYALQILQSGVIPENIITPVDLIVAK